jgi:hypothetical protein
MGIVNSYEVYGTSSQFRPDSRAKYCLKKIFNDFMHINLKYVT